MKHQDKNIMMLLCKISDNNITRISNIELAEMAKVSTRTVSSVLKELETNKYISRKRFFENGLNVREIIILKNPK